MSDNGSRAIYADDLKIGMRLDVPGIGKDCEVRAVSHVGDSDYPADYTTVATLAVDGEDIGEINLDPHQQLRRALSLKDRERQALDIFERMERREW